MDINFDKTKVVKGLEAASWILTTVSTIILNGEATTEKKKKIGIYLGIASAVALSVTEYVKENVPDDKEENTLEEEKQKAEENGDTKK